MNAKFTPKAPSLKLKMRSKENGELISLTGLFEGVTKSGINRLSGFDKENDLGYSMLPKTVKGSGEETGSYSLSVREGADGAYVKLCEMSPQQAKDGTSYLKGVSEDGTEYVAFPFVPKDKPASPKAAAAAAPQRPFATAAKPQAQAPQRRTFGAPGRS